MLKPYDVVRTGPRHRYPNRWCRILWVAPCGTRAITAVYPEGHEKPKPVGRQ
jgi:hypothetical protein